MSVPAPTIITCREWGAVQPTSPPVVCGRPNKILVHHTAGHHPEISLPQDESYAELCRYALSIQHDHMVRRGWNDSGHSFLIGRNGLILQGRWGTVTAIERGHMVVSAHCPGENTNPGVEHEHAGTEPMTDAQTSATIMLMAWICDRTGISPTQLFGHKVFYPTSCPANLSGVVYILRAKVATHLNEYGRSNPPKLTPRRTALAVRREVAV